MGNSMILFILWSKSSLPKPVHTSPTSPCRSWTTCCSDEHKQTPHTCQACTRAEIHKSRRVQQSSTPWLVSASENTELEISGSLLLDGGTSNWKNELTSTQMMWEHGTRNSKAAHDNDPTAHDHPLLDPSFRTTNTLTSHCFLPPPLEEVSQFPISNTKYLTGNLVPTAARHSPNLVSTR